MVVVKEDPIVSVSQGRLKGVVEQLCDGSRCYSFKGIPYAQPPVGELRFKAPLPPKQWSGIFEATEHGPICPQINMTKMDTDREDENCLFLNIYTKSLESNARIPVMVYIHGGAFMSGSGNSNAYGPDYLLQHDIILVTINYRVEVFGFLCLHTPEVPGNAGMKDQVAALRWIQNNIAEFGGDPNNITLFGNSAGGASVTYHMISQMSRGLFHRAIIQSGVCLMDWTQGKGCRERAFRLAKLFGKETNDITELYEFLKLLPVEALTSKVSKKTLNRNEENKGLPIHFCPVVEKKFDGIEQFLTENPIESIVKNKVNKVPLIIGYNSREGYFFVNYNLKILHVINKNPSLTVPRELTKNVSDDDLKSLGKAVKRYYFGDRDCTEYDVLKMCDRDTDSYMAYPVHRFTHLYSKLFNPIYMYRFSCDTDLNHTKRLLGLSHMKGACHADEVYYLFRNFLVKDAYDEQDKLKNLVYNITRLWTNFAKKGNPTPDGSLSIKWDPYTTTNKEYMNIDETLSMGTYPDRDRMEFWDSMYSEAGLPSMNWS